MRLLLITAFLMLGVAAWGPGAYAQEAAPDASPHNTSTGLPPFGGSFESRLERLGADVDGGVKDGWMNATQARSFSTRIAALGDELKAVRRKNGGRLPGADNSRLQDKVTALHKEMGELASASRRRLPPSR